MIDMLQSLFRHQAWADAATLEAVKAHAKAANHAKLRTTLYHIVLVQRAFLAVFLEHPMDFKREMQVPDTLAEVKRRFRETSPELISYVDNLDETALARAISVPWFPDACFSLAEALMQVVMHSQHHRGQCLAQLRELGGIPPAVDFIVWTKDRPAPVWR